ncbi:MAG TPA: response regulator transcription factor [Saprospiraceae bacterium]|nr:response regulator transcription factor [Saprospiraceae bacterium]
MLLIDEQEIVFLGLKQLFVDHDIEIELCIISNSNKCFESLKSSSYDLIILDINIPETDSIGMLTKILSQLPKQKILIYSASPEQIYAKRLLQLGAYGYVSKSSPNSDLLKAVKCILGGQKYISEVVRNLLSDEVINNKNNKDLFDRLSAREFEVMKLFLEGHGSKEISNLTDLHSSTIGTYKTKIFKKLGVHNLLELLELAKVYGIHG